jgi:protein-S-isoprenylcysteine O-methyltransferase Ste14
MEIVFKIAFYIVFFSFAYVMVYYSKRAKINATNSSDRIKQHNENEVPLLLKLRTIFGIPFYIGVLVWTFAPKLMEWSTINLPEWARWAGLGLGLASIAVNMISHRTLSQKLGADFDPALRLIEVPALVTDGIYARVRHPIYLAFLLMQISLLFLTSNWFVGLCGIAIIVAVIAIRIPEEERLLIAKFGDEYHNYKKRTGALLPRFI